MDTEVKDAPKKGIVMWLNLDGFDSFLERYDLKSFFLILIIFSFLAPTLFLGAVHTLYPYESTFSENVTAMLSFTLGNTGEKFAEYLYAPLFEFGENHPYFALTIIILLYSYVIWDEIRTIIKVRKETNLAKIGHENDRTNTDKPS